MHDYFFLNSQGKQCGPVSPSKFAENGVKPTTLVWCSGMSDWAPAESVEELRDFFTPYAQRQETPPEPPQSQETWRSAANGPQPQPAQTYWPCPNTHMPEAILVTICCCLPFGIVAIVKATQVSSFYRQGMYDQAAKCSNDAWNWVLWSIVGGLLSFGTGALVTIL